MTINNIDYVTGYVHSVETMGATDGPGIRTIFFLQGCPLRCVFCHNPDTWAPNTGKKMTSCDVLKTAKRYRPYTKNGGITLSGGEPLLQSEFCLDIISLCKKAKIHTAIDTSGFVNNDIAKQVILNCDIVLLDIKSIDNDKCIAISGHSNENAKSLLDLCEKNNKPVWIRHVIIPELTYNFDDISALGAYLKPFSCVEKVDLLPFHQLGKHKWEQLSYHYQLANTPALTPTQLNNAKEWFDASYK